MSIRTYVLWKQKIRKYLSRYSSCLEVFRLQHFHYIIRGNKNQWVVKHMQINLCRTKKTLAITIRTGAGEAITWLVITKTCLYSFDPLKPHFYIVKLRFTGVYIIFLISAQKHRLLVLLEPPLQGGSNEF